MCDGVLSGHTPPLINLEASAWRLRDRDLELRTISKYMQDMSKKIFDAAANHPNSLLQSAVSYEPPPPPHHFIRRPRNVLSGPPDELTAEVASGVFWSVKVGHTPRTRVRGSSLGLLSPSPRKEKTKKKKERAVSSSTAADEKTRRREEAAHRRE
ncbi:hypothetical protein EVAR_69888_1 [Eumeta japonica]|uniref:Uncharacterized protein n=1 Tax=Eumeta variegata TaxID=151549 RepID=A0A4C1ZVF0_EUMVA|nr:hypothetical protein EVAR_69888_1 [Eumeta japonica]